MFFTSIFLDSKVYNYAIFGLKSEKYPNLSKTVSDIKYTIINRNELNEDNIFLGIYNIQELSDKILTIL